MFKKFLLGVGCLVLIGCNQSVEIVEILEEQEENPYEVYEQWAIEYPYAGSSDYYPYFMNNGSDCVGLENGLSYGGDLLSTMIVQNPEVEWMELEVYKDPAYVANLESKIANYGAENFDRGFFAFYACHLDDEIDLVAGTFWPIGKPACEDAYYNCFQGEDARRSLVLVDGDFVFSFEDVKLLDNTVTGGEVYPCKASYQDGIILWECLEGVDFDAGIRFNKLWEITLDGTISDSVEYMVEI